MTLVACGGDDEPSAAAPAVEDADRQEIADVINEVREGFAAGDGATVCDRLTKGGQAYVVTLAAQHGDGTTADTCEEAVAGFTKGLPKKARGELAGEGPYEPEDIDLDSPEDSTRIIVVPCIDDDVNAWFAFHESDDSWDLTVPFCSAR